MVRIFNYGEKITYTKGDTFEMEVNGDNFEAGDICTFVVAKDEDSEAIIDANFNLSVDYFAITLSPTEKAQLDIGEYIYKIIITSIDGNIVTQKSGDFIVKWGV